jgi:hypothetical protein
MVPFIPPWKFVYRSKFYSTSFKRRIRGGRLHYPDVSGQHAPRKSMLPRASIGNNIVRFKAAVTRRKPPTFRRS